MAGFIGNFIAGAAETGSQLLAKSSLLDQQTQAELMKAQRVMEMQQQFKVQDEERQRANAAKAGQEITAGGMIEARQPGVSADGTLTVDGAGLGDDKPVPASRMDTLRKQLDVAKSKGYFKEADSINSELQTEIANRRADTQERRENERAAHDRETARISEKKADNQFALLMAHNREQVAAIARSEKAAEARANRDDQRARITLLHDSDNNLKIQQKELEDQLNNTTNPPSDAQRETIKNKLAAIGQQFESNNTLRSNFAKHGSFDPPEVQINDNGPDGKFGVRVGKGPPAYYDTKEEAVAAAAKLKGLTPKEKGPELLNDPSLKAEEQPQRLGDKTLDYSEYTPPAAPGMAAKAESGGFKTNEYNRFFSDAEVAKGVAAGNMSAIAEQERRNKNAPPPQAPMEKGEYNMFHSDKQILAGVAVGNPTAIAEAKRRGLK